MFRQENFLDRRTVEHFWTVEHYFRQENRRTFLDRRTGELFWTGEQENFLDRRTGELFWTGEQENMYSHDCSTVLLSKIKFYCSPV